MKTYKLTDKIYCNECKKEITDKELNPYDYISNKHLCTECFNYLSNISLFEPTLVRKYNIYNSLEWVIEKDYIQLSSKELNGYAIIIKITDNLEKDKNFAIKMLFKLYDELTKRQLK